MRAASVRVRAPVFPIALEVVAHCALGQHQAAGDIRHRGAITGGGEAFAFAGGQRVLSGRQGFGSERRVDDAQPGVHPPDRVGQPFRGRVFDHEARCAGLHGAAEVAWAPERRHDEHPAGRQSRPQRRPQRRGGADAVQSWHLDVEQGNVGLGTRGGGHHVVAGADLGHHGEIRFQG
jgi:hypothetical protein